MGDSFRGMLPPVYQPLFDPFFDKEKVKETRAECEKCSMCNHGEPSPVPMEYFRTDTKCCTYWPQLPNYLVGAILADPSPEQEEGKKRLRKIIASRMAVTPNWVSRPGRWQLYLSAYGNAFGRAKTLRCPFFDQEHPDKSCTIWRHRETICMTYYCKYNGGQRGYDFWVAFKDYLAQVQSATVRFATEAIDTSLFTPQFSKDLTVEELDDEPPKEADYVRMWGKWVGHEEEFYIKCYEWLASVPREQFMLNVDSIESVKAALDKLKAAHEVLEAKLLPANLVRNPRMREQHVNDKVVVTTYHRYDSFALDKDLYDVVGLFRGDQSLAENLERLKKDGIELAPDLVEFLFAAGVLIAPPKKMTSDPEDPKALEARRISLDAILTARNIKLDEAQTSKLAEPMNAAQLDALVVRASTAKTADDLFVNEEPKK